MALAEIEIELQYTLAEEVNGVLAAAGLHGKSELLVKAVHILPSIFPDLDLDTVEVNFRNASKQSPFNLKSQLRIVAEENDSLEVDRKSFLALSPDVQSSLIIALLVGLVCSPLLIRSEELSVPIPSAVNACFKDCVQTVVNIHLGQDDVDAEEVEKRVTEAIERAVSTKKSKKKVDTQIKRFVKPTQSQPSPEVKAGDNTLLDADAVDELKRYYASDEDLEGDRKRQVHGATLKINRGDGDDRQNWAATIIGDAEIPERRFRLELAKEIDLHSIHHDDVIKADLVVIEKRDQEQYAISYIFLDKFIRKIEPETQ